MTEAVVLATVVLATEATEPKVVTVEECLASGGHCYVSDGMIRPTYPAQYPEHCKHCPARRVGMTQPLMSYRDTTAL